MASGLQSNAGRCEVRTIHNKVMTSDCQTLIRVGVGLQKPPSSCPWNDAHNASVIAYEKAFIESEKYQLQN